MGKLVACLACRNSGSRLYGKPLQNLDIENSITILDYMIAALRKTNICDEIVLAISNDPHSIVFEQVAIKNGVKFIFGDEEDVLGRLIKACEYVDGTDIFRLTTESPFTYFEAIEAAWKSHQEKNADFTPLDDLPDGSGFEITSLEAYKTSWKKGATKHRSELCSLYIRENKDLFKFNLIKVPEELKRLDIRLTVDYPEDLVLCRFVYESLKHEAPLIPLREIIQLLDKNENYKLLVKKYVDEGLETMYL